ncbi:zinc finger protein 704 isoform X1 [Paramormyrops kingsleyae]|uniref:zinc finger protein 704 isoform X1 n=2 Tax=Paramormyrops kingsleyae TaxID=1676925 RepID=UPI000CD6673E|nr:zinc finger protein 704-like isoform X1 [Paramormyrops kingsleyae]
MHSRRLVKRSLLGSRVCAGDGALLPGVVHAVKHENRDAPMGPRQSLCAALKQEGSLREYFEGDAAVCQEQTPAAGPLRSSLKQSSCNGHVSQAASMPMKCREKEPRNGAAESTRDPPGLGDKPAEPEKELTRSVSLLEQKRKVVSSSIDVPHTRKKEEEEVDMDKVTAAMVLTSLSTSPLVRSPPVKVTEGSNGSWKDAGSFTPSSHSSSGYWSWSIPSDQSNPSTPSPPLSADSFKPFRMPAVTGQPDDALDEPDGSSLLFDEPIPRKRKNSMKVMFKCLWKNCGKVLGTAAGIQKHIRTTHLWRNCESECSDGEEDFYYTEIKLNTDSVSDVLCGLSPLPRPVFPPPPPPDPGRPDGGGGSGGTKGDGKLSTPLSRSAPSALYLVHTDHAYQATAPVTIPGSTSFSPSSTGPGSFSVSWQSPSVTFTGVPVSAAQASPPHSQTKGSTEQRPPAAAILASPPRATGLLRKSRGEGKKCRKVYGMENRDMWCTACRWKKACQRFVD